MQTSSRCERCDIPSVCDDCVVLPGQGQMDLCERCKERYLTLERDGQAEFIEFVMNRREDKIRKKQESYRVKTENVISPAVADVPSLLGIPHHLGPCSDPNCAICRQVKAVVDKPILVPSTHGLTQCDNKKCGLCYEQGAFNEEAVKEFEPLLVEKIAAGIKEDSKVLDTEMGKVIKESMKRTNEEIQEIVRRMNAATKNLGRGFHHIRASVSSEEWPFCMGCGNAVNNFFWDGGNILTCHSCTKDVNMVLKTFNPPKDREYSYWEKDSWQEDDDKKYYPPRVYGEPVEKLIQNDTPAQPSHTAEKRELLPNGDIRITYYKVNNTGAQHFDRDKLPLELVDPILSKSVAKVLQFGISKGYQKNNWRKGMEWSRVLGSLERHIADWKAGDTNDLESTLNHLAHAACDIMFLLYYERKFPELDDRLFELPEKQEFPYRDLTSAEAGRPTIVCLCGSTKFKDAYQEANLKETLKGKIVLSVGCYAHSDTELGITEETKVQLDVLHKRKIDLCDEVFVINVGSYIGSSTRSEIEYAKKIGKRVRYLEDELVKDDATTKGNK